jgi:hypothetical protein
MKITSRDCIVDRHPFERQAHSFVVPTGVLSVVERVVLPEGAGLAVLPSEEIEPFIAEVGVMDYKGDLAYRRIIFDSMGCCALYAMTADTAEGLRDGKKSVLEISAVGFIEPNGLLSSTSRNLRMTAGAINRALEEERAEASGTPNISRGKTTLELTGYEIQLINYERVAPAEFLRTSPMILSREAAIRDCRTFPIKSTRAGH